jgi:hypothetical protein
MKENKEPYYYPTEGVLGQDCTQKCMVKDNGVMIGSAQCQECVFCTDKAEQYDEYTGPEWIVCSRIDEAIHGVYPEFLTDKQEGMTTQELMAPIYSSLAMLFYYMLGAYVVYLVMSLPLLYHNNVFYVEFLLRIVIICYINSHIFKYYENTLNKIKNLNNTKDGE